MYEIEQKLIEEEKYYVVGIDEVGRGCLCGDVIVAAVCVDIRDRIEGVKDSKKLSEKKRNIFAKEIKERAIDFSIAGAPPSVIDKINIKNATKMAMENALNELLKKLAKKNIKPDFVLVDAEKIKTEIPHLAVNHGDDLCYSIACASILAKVYRDSLCPKWDEEYPGYNFSKHKGYATTAHRAAIIELGASPIHRKSFLKNLDIWKKNANIMGIVGEDLAVNFLTENGYEILDRNFRDYFGEIDIIAKKDDTISFVEVKERVSDAFGNAFEFVDKNKQEKIKKCAVSYLISKKIEDLQPRFDVVEVYPNEKKINFYEDAFQ